MKSHITAFQKRLVGWICAMVSRKPNLDKSTNIEHF